MSTAPVMMPGAASHPIACLLAVSLMSGFFALAPAQAASSNQEGRKDAVAYCSACHRVTKDQKQPPAVFDPDEARSLEAPSFDVIATRYSGRADALRHFIRAPRHPMREQQFLPQDLRAIVRYIASLRAQRW